MVLQLIEKGWIPGPGEKQPQFYSRVKALEHFFSYPPEDLDQFLTDTDWSGAREATKRLYGFSPDWIIAHYSNDKLSFFQGAATWIVMQNDLRIPIVQLKEKFEQGSLLKLYRREEVLSHEAVHAARMQFDEPIFEEFFAYKTSPYFWRRIFGPLFQRPWEAYLFVILALIPFAVEVSLYFYPQIDFLPFLSLIPAVFLGLLLLRLAFLHLTLALALKRLGAFLEKPNKKWAAALFLKDREIFRLAFLSKKKLKMFVKKGEGFRWKVLRDSYFKKWLF